MRHVLLAASLLMGGCDESPGFADRDVSNNDIAGRSLIDATGIVVYRTGDKVPECDLVPLDPQEFGGELIDTDVEWSGRLDLVTETLVGGVFQATRGSYRVVYPGSTHVTIHAGKVNVTTPEGTFELRPVRAHRPVRVPRDLGDLSVDARSRARERQRHRRARGGPPRSYDDDGQRRSASRAQKGRRVPDEARHRAAVVAGQQTRTGALLGPRTMSRRAKHGEPRDRGVPAV